MGEAAVLPATTPIDRRSRVSLPETAALFVVLVVLFFVIPKLRKH